VAAAWATSGLALPGLLVQFPYDGVSYDVLSATHTSTHFRSGYAVASCTCHPYPGSGDPDADDEFGREDAEWDVYREVAKVCHALIMT